MVNNSRNNIEANKCSVQPATQNHDYYKKEHTVDFSQFEKYIDKLDEHEKEELKEYQEVYFFGRSIENEASITKYNLSYVHW